ncbi:MAG: hypothetical protein KDC67_06215, partial [Ignavibacteriae bacterium]|nr:hypothetical protein [Ignavibacteriota bacterium]
MAIQKVLITVKTYPTLSRRYDELVCTAGVLEDGTWIRIYPVPFRKLDYVKQYKKYDWIELDLVKNSKDFRPESYRPSSLEADIKVIDHIGTEGNWHERKKFVLNEIYEDTIKLISEAKDKNNQKSIAVFKPKRVHDFIYTEDSKEWDPKKVEVMNQMNLFEKRDGEFKIVRKLPYKFYYKVEDSNGKIRTMMIEDWEIGALYWNSLKRAEGNEGIACEKVKQKYFDDFAKTKDIFLYLGTTRNNHYVSKNPFVIIGTFTPKIEDQ